MSRPFGFKHSEETIRKMSEIKKGKRHSEETCQLLSVQRMGVKTRPHTEETKRKMSASHIGKTFTLEHRRMLSENHADFRGDKGSSWKGGLSFEPYCVKFNDEFKERVRAFFGHVCQLCRKPQNGKKLDVHHVNFDKMTCCNDVKPLFVPLCHSCHMKTNFNRKYYEQHFEEVIMTKFEGNCYLPKIVRGV